MRTCSIVFGLTLLGPALAQPEVAEAIFKDTVELMNEMTDVLKPVKDKAGAEAALPKLRTINERLAGLKKREQGSLRLIPDESRPLFAKHKAPIEAAIKALDSEMARIEKLPEARAMLKRELSRFDEAS